MADCILIRRLPGGEITAHATPFVSARAAADAAARVLHDNAGVWAGDGQKFADALAAQPLGTILDHPSGYDFRILRADVTADGVAITPGLRVFNYYDRQWGTVCRHQFMRTAPLAPGGRFFEGWYDVAREGDGSVSMLNGERLAVQVQP